MIIDSDVHIVTWSLKPVKDSLTSSECPACNHPVAHVLKAVQYVHLQSWKLIFHSPLHTKFSISLNICERDLNCWLKIYFHFFLLKRLKNQFCSIITLLIENFVLLIFQSSEKAQKKHHITFSIITLLVENSILLFLSSRTSRLCQEVNLWEFLGRNCPPIWIISRTQILEKFTWRCIFHPGS